MDKLSRYCYENRFERDYVVKQFDEFQDMFSRIMEMRYPNDFTRVCPWGKDGDWKNDGYLRSRKQIFQVYAPHELEKAQTLKKMEDDCSGALAHWNNRIDIWTFVHNSPSGVPPFVLSKLLDLETNHAGLTATQWGFAELRSELFSLNENEIASLLGPVPTERSMMDIRYDDIRIVLANIPAGAYVVDTDMRSVPPEKLKANGLSSYVQALLLAGFQKSAQVGKFFNEWDDPTFGDRVASAFQARYSELRQEALLPDEIFQKLQVFAGGLQVGQPHHQAAVLAVLAYLFESCDIFERSLGTLGS
jgi:hypothetical protein